VKNKRQLDLIVATMLNKKKEEVSAITSLFCMTIMNAVIDDGVVHIDGFGRLRLNSSQQGSRPRIETLKKVRNGEVIGDQRIAIEKKYTVTFKKASPFRQRIRKKYGKAPIVEERTMEKKAVDSDDKTSP